MQEHVRLHDTFDIEIPIALRVDIRRAHPDLLAIDRSIDNDMAHVNPFGTVFLGHCLGQRPQARLGRIERAITGQVTHRFALGRFRSKVYSSAAIPIYTPFGQWWHMKIIDRLSGLSVERALKVLSGRWKAVILRALLDGAQRTCSLQNRIVGISQKVLIEQLRALEAHGMVRRRPSADDLAGY
jgi:hypothetical protein